MDQEVLQFYEEFLEATSLELMTEIRDAMTAAQKFYETDVEKDMGEIMDITLSTIKSYKKVFKESDFNTMRAIFSGVYSVFANKWTNKRGRHFNE